MAVDVQIFTRASTFAALTALVPAARIVPEKELSGTPVFPYVTFTLVSTVEKHHTFSGALDRDDQYRFDIFATSHAEARDIGAQVYAAFEFYNDGTICCRFDDESEIGVDDEHVFHRRLDFLVYTQSA